MRPILRAPSALALAAFIAACGSSATSEDDIRALVDAAEIATEEREADVLGELIADDYADPAGRTAGDVRRFLHGWLIAHPSVHLITRIDSIEIANEDFARLEVTVGMLGREAGDSWDLAGDVYRLDLSLAREDGDWYVIRAELQDGV